MDAIISLRAFHVDDPTAYDTAGALAETDNGNWIMRPESPDDDRFAAAIDAYVDDELADLDNHEPAPQAIYDGVVVVLDELIFEIVEDDVEYRYPVDVQRMQAICSSKTDPRTGLVAERTIDDDHLADGMQRSADALDHRITWLDVISPRSFTGIAEAAQDLMDAVDEDATEDGDGTDDRGPGA